MTKRLNLKVTTPLAILAQRAIDNPTIDYKGPARDFFITASDCSTDSGVTIGLIDAMLTMARILAPRVVKAKLNGFRDAALCGALFDLQADKHLRTVLRTVPIMTAEESFNNMVRILKEARTKYDSEDVTHDDQTT